jgi:hypothetical protein
MLLIYRSFLRGKKWVAATDYLSPSLLPQPLHKAAAEKAVSHNNKLVINKINTSFIEIVCMYVPTMYLPHSPREEKKNRAQLGIEPRTSTISVCKLVNQSDPKDRIIPLDHWAGCRY